MATAGGVAVKNSMGLRLAVAAVVGFCLFIPLVMIDELVRERAGRRDEAVDEIARMWAAPQTLSGPVLTVSHRCDVPKNPPCVNQINLQPLSLTIDGVLEPEERRRSLFKSVVYRSRLRVRGTFDMDVAARGVPADYVSWQDATVTLGVTDPRGITGSAAIRVAGTLVPFVPGARQQSGISSGIHARVGTLPQPAPGPMPFEFELTLNGTREIQFDTFGDTGQITLTSTWPHPAFVGAFLPDIRTTDGNGFSATWNGGAFRRSAPSPRPAASSQGTHAEGSASNPTKAFGVALVTPVDVYQQTDRAVKYGVLFIFFTFAMAFLWEVTRGVLVHPIQYGFIGFALCVFYLLLLSVSEHAGFDVAYLAGTAAVVSLLAWYWRWVAGRWLDGASMGSLVAGLYGFMYLLLRLEDYALLAGSLGLFVMLVLVMYLTRRVDWFNFGQSAGQSLP
jgi:inner membrane protein